MDTASDPQQGSEPIWVVDVDDQEKELVEWSNFDVSVEADRSFKHLRRVSEASLPPLASPQPAMKGIVIREPTDLTPTEVAFSGKDKHPVGTGPSASMIYVRFPSNLMDLTREQCGELLGHLGNEADVASVAQ